MPIFKDESAKATPYKKGSGVLDEKKFSKAFELLDINNDGLYDLIIPAPVVPKKMRLR
jgi:hypothetical protein